MTSGNKAYFPTTWKINLNCVCPYIFMSAHSSICVHYMRSRNRHYVSSPSFSNLNLETGSPSTRSSPISLVWLTSRLQGSACLLLPAMGCQSGFLKTYSFFKKKNLILFYSFILHTDPVSPPYSPPSIPTPPPHFFHSHSERGRPLAGLNKASVRIFKVDSRDPTWSP